MTGMQTLSGKVVLVTGGGGGLGAAICRSLAACGAQLVIGDSCNEAAAEVAHGVRAAGGEAWPLALDVSDAASVEAGVAQIVRRCGRIDAVVNNAGVDVTCPIEALTIGDWDRILRTNLSGPFYLCRAALPRLRESAGQVVNIVSTAARRAWPNAAAYHASKYGLLGLSHALHAELRPYGIRVTAILAGGMRTPFLLERFPDIPPENLQDPENVAAAVRFALTQPPGTVVAELMVLPLRESSWP